ncbi:MAG: hypothetical protein AAGC93_08055 [Cyanobacteria bacterium P01_F01_bin.53]
MMKFKSLIMLALTTCALIVMGTGLVQAIFMPNHTFSIMPSTTVLAQGVLEEATIPPEVEEINQATLEYLQDGRESLPESPTISRTVVDEDYAIATWSWGEAGGQSVLSRTEEGWTVLVSGGGAVDISVLEGAGVPTDIAEQLMTSDQAARSQEATP